MPNDPSNKPGPTYRFGELVNKVERTGSVHDEARFGQADTVPFGIISDSQATG